MTRVTPHSSLKSPHRMNNEPNLLLTSKCQIIFLPQAVGAHTEHELLQLLKLCSYYMSTCIYLNNNFGPNTNVCLHKHYLGNRGIFYLRFCNECDWQWFLRPPHFMIFFICKVVSDHHYYLEPIFHHHNLDKLSPTFNNTSC